ncbi:CpsD/CapB family tyrosine-protein kinase [Sphingomonas sp. BGYR3]|uniref:CpsD/CapB family tyrosine-protein kinase n=1 Tax=Sphingomonas sp. BGYR3 TaxID=2975483 RepID=UPI0021A4565B|nr:CpsD/CapB family tyrosine-protein kinase [Sphingomonas sp. BGYR3]MDG5489258.1 CpsD/CapB family tyrosine-protein kinase [Sphingomonas sp. BGYR3]
MSKAASAISETTTPAAGAGKAPLPEPVTYSVSPDVVVLDQQGGAQAESIGSLRTHLIATHIRNGRRALGICSSDGESGSEFVAVNLAVSLAQAGIRTLLIDGNMRTPFVETAIIPSRPVPNLRQLLTDETLSISDTIQADVIPHLSVLYSGGPAADAQELLNGARFKQVIDTCMRDHELTLILTPPTNRCADARRIASVVRYVLIVARRDVSFVDDLSTLVTQLNGDGAMVIGSVMNV